MDSVSPTRRQQDRAAAIAAELASLGLALPGSLIQRRVRCGRAGCRCHHDPPELHGPYWQWTRKQAGKTITRLVPDDQVEDYRQWLDNHRRLRELVTELEQLTLAVADQNAGRDARAAKPGRTPHNTVDAARLTRGHVPDQPASAQVKPKCEGLTLSSTLSSTPLAPPFFVCLFDKIDPNYWVFIFA